MKKFASRKFIITLVVLFVDGILTYFEVPLDANVVIAIIVSYNGMQGLVDNTVAKNGN